MGGNGDGAGMRGWLEMAMVLECAGWVEVVLL